MKLTLFRRRQIWLPTFFGWLVLFVFMTIAVMFGGRQLYSLLSSNAPATGAKVLVVEGWLDEDELDQAVIAFHDGHYLRVVTSGGPIEAWTEMLGVSNYAERAARYLKTHGLENADVMAVPAPASAQERTFLSAAKVRDWLTKQKVRVGALDVMSGGVHARRTQMLYRLAFGPDVDIGILSATPSEYNRMQWWKTSAGAKDVMGETISLIWTICFFYPPKPGSHEEMWGETALR